MKLSTIAGIVAGAVTPARGTEAKPQAPFEDVLSELASEETAPLDAGVAAGEARSGSALAATLAPSVPNTKASAPDRGAARSTVLDQSSEALDPGAMDAPPEPTPVMGYARPIVVGSAAIATPVADVLELASRAADPVRRAVPMQAEPSVAAAPFEAAVPSLSAEVTAKSPGALAQPRPASVLSPHARSTRPDGSPPNVEAPLPDGLAASGTMGAVVASVPFLAARLEMAHAPTASSATVAPPSFANSDLVPLSASLGVSALVKPVSASAMIEPPPATRASKEVDVSAIETSSAGARAMPSVPAPADDPVFDVAPMRGAPPPGSAERTIAQGVENVDGPEPDQSALADAVSVVAQISPGTVKVESHLGFMAAPIPTLMGKASAASPPPLGSLPGRSFDVSRGLPAAGARERLTTPGGAPDGPLDIDGDQPAFEFVAPSVIRSAARTAASDPRAETAALSFDPTHAPADVSSAVTATTSMASVGSPSDAPLARQIADGVTGLAAAVPDPDARAPQVGPARSMVLQLSPHGLGTLSVHLHVAGRTLDVRLEASDSRTTALIDRDRGALADALRGKDYQLQSLTVSTHATAAMPGGTYAERGTDPGSGRSSEPYRGDGSSGGRGRRDAPGTGAHAQEQDDAVVDRVSASLFV